MHHGGARSASSVRKHDDPRWYEEIFEGKRALTDTLKLIDNVRDEVYTLPRYLTFPTNLLASQEKGEPAQAKEV